MLEHCACLGVDDDLVGRAGVVRVRQCRATALDALRDFIRDGQDGQLDLRDPSLLKLFFGGIASRADIVALALAELAQHEQQLTTYESTLSVRHDAPHQVFAGQQCGWD